MRPFTGEAESPSTGDDVPAYPIWALLIIAGDVAALYGLCVCGGRQEAAAY